MHSAVKRKNKDYQPEADPPMAERLKEKD